MANEEHKLPWELTEEILSRVPPKSIVRFRTVCKRWKVLFEDKIFINNYKSSFRFILATKSKVYSVSVNPKIEVCELTLDVPGLEYQKPEYFVDGNGFLLCCMDKEAVVWNPCLKQTRWIKPEVNQTIQQFFGIGYYEYDDNGKLEESGYKTLACYLSKSEPTKPLLKIHDFGSDVWKDRKFQSGSGSSKATEGVTIDSKSGVPLHGSLYWLASYHKAPLFGLVFFDFSHERLFSYCGVPCGKNHDRDALVLSVFMGDRFSLLKQCHLTKKIEIWVTKNKNHKGFGRDVEWMNFMQVSSPNLPDLVQTGPNSKPSYFMDDKKLVVCCCDENGRAWIYVMGENKLISKIQLDSVVDLWPLHCTYLPSLVPVPRGKREEVELKV